MFSSIVTFLKAHWVAILLIVVAAMFAYSYWDANSRATKLLNELSAAETRHRIELDNIQKAHDEQVKARDATLKQLEAEIATIEAQYITALEKLDAKKKAEVKKLVNDFHDDPAELARLLSEATGIPLYVHD